MAKKNNQAKEPEAPPSAQTLRTAEPPDSPFPSQTPAEVAVENGADNQNESHTFDQVEQWRAEAEKWQAAHGEACANLARIHAFAVGDVRGPARGVVEDVEDAIAGLRERVAELEGAQAQDAPEINVLVVPAVVEDDLAAAAYDLFRQNQAEGDFPSWDALDTPTQKLWRDSYAHVAAGGEPRTDYECAVKYLMASAQ